MADSGDVHRTDNPFRSILVLAQIHKRRKNVRYLGYCHQAYEMFKIRLNESFNTVYSIIIIMDVQPFVGLGGRLFIFLIL